MNENELLTQIQKIVNSANEELKEEMVELKEEIKQLDLKLEQNIAELKDEIKRVDLKLEQNIAELKDEIKRVDLKLEQEIKQLNLKMEFDVERKIDIILDYITLQQENESKQNEEIRNLSKRTEHNELKIINCEKRVEILEKDNHLETLESFN